MSIFFLYGIYRLFGVRITSFYRTPEYNREVGGVATSLHSLFGALDVGFDAPDSMIELARKLGFKVLTESTHYHIERTNQSDIFFSANTVSNHTSISNEAIEIISPLFSKEN